MASAALKALRVAVVGSGVSGLAAARALQRVGVANVKIFERNRGVQDNPRAGHLSFMPPKGSSLLKDLNISKWELKGSKPISKIQYAGSDAAAGSIDFNTNAVSKYDWFQAYNNSGQFFRRGDLIAALAGSLPKDAIEFRKTVSSVTDSQVLFEDGSSYDADLVILADGRDGVITPRAMTPSDLAPFPFHQTGADIVLEGIVPRSEVKTKLPLKTGEWYTQLFERVWASMADIGDGRIMWRMLLAEPEYTRSAELVKHRGPLYDWDSSLADLDERAYWDATTHMDNPDPVHATFWNVPTGEDWSGKTAEEASALDYETVLRNFRALSEISPDMKMWNAVAVATPIKNEGALVEYQQAMDLNRYSLQKDNKVALGSAAHLMPRESNSNDAESLASAWSMALALAENGPEVFASAKKFQTMRFNQLANAPEFSRLVARESSTAGQMRVGQLRAKEDGASTLLSWRQRHMLNHNIYNYFFSRKHFDGYDIHRSPEDFLPKDVAEDLAPFYSQMREFSI